MSEIVIFVIIGALLWFFIMPIFEKAQKDGIKRAIELDRLKKWDEDRRKVEILKAAFPKYTQPPEDK